MTEEIKKICAEKLNCSIKDISLSKFFHGDGKRSEKILFLVTVKGQPVCMLKMMRNIDLNDQLTKEYEAQGIAGSKNIVAFRIPKNLFKSSVLGFVITGEEVITGGVINKNQAASYLKNVADFERSIMATKNVATKKIKVRDIVSLLGAYSIDNELMAILKKNTEKNVVSSFSHGDLTFRNLIVDDKGMPVLIDWQHSWIRPIWGLDFVHYYVRALGIETLDDAAKAIDKVKEITPEIGDDFVLLYALDKIFDSIYKKGGYLKAAAFANSLIMAAE